MDSFTGPFQGFADFRENTLKEYMWLLHMFSICYANKKLTVKKILCWYQFFIYPHSWFFTKHNKDRHFEWHVLVNTSKKCVIFFGKAGRTLVADLVYASVHYLKSICGNLIRDAMLEIIIKTIKRKMAQMMNHIKEYGYQDD